MKTIITFCTAFIFFFYVSAQQQLFYVCAGYELLKINVATCDTTFIGYSDFVGDSIVLLDIAITQDHSLYGIDGVFLYQIDTLNAHLTRIANLDSLNVWLNGINSLVADSAGNLLTVSRDSLYQINRFTGQPVTLGYIGYDSYGDLTFYNDTLYLVGGTVCCIADLIKIIIHPIVSASIVGAMNATNMYGINTVCINGVETMIASGLDNTGSSLYKVNTVNANLTLLCHDITYWQINGAASIYDINGIEVGCSVISGVREKLFNNTVEVYPNPFTDHLTIAAKSTEPLEIVIYDIASQKIMEQQFTGSLTLNTRRLAAGVYIYEVKNNAGGAGEVIDRGKIVKF